MSQCRHKRRREAKQTERLITHLSRCGALAGSHGQQLKHDANERLDAIRRKAK